MSAEREDRPGSRIDRLARLFGAIVLARWDEVAALRRNAPDGEPDRAWREAVLQTHVFAGFPRLVKAYEVLAEAGGLGALEEDEIEAPYATAGDAVEAERRGLALFERIYAEKSGGVRTMLEGHHPDFARSILVHAYGRVLARPGLTPAERELLAVAGLIALGQHRQLASHVRGAVRCGADPDELPRIASALEPLIDAEELMRAREVIERFRHVREPRPKPPKPPSPEE